jgi:16S rRNA G966 N2-methylase RsmD
MKLKLLLSPLAKAAYFGNYLEVAHAEFLAHYPECDVRPEKLATLDYLNVELYEEELQQLSRLSFVQGIFKEEGDKLIVLNQEPGFVLPEELVYAAKYQGKTNELVTQLAINIGIVFASIREGEVPRLLDPMAGRGTTMLWALRYGMNASGIEQDRKALAGLHQHLKKQTKLLRIKHQHSQGFIGRSNKQQRGKFDQFQFADRTLRLTIGDSREAGNLTQGKRFHLLVCDLPYGIQHASTEGTRNPLPVVRECAPAWVDCLRKGGVLVLIFNSYQPARSDLMQLFVEQGLQPQDFSAPHRMSESIVRDLIIFKKI